MKVNREKLLELGKTTEILTQTIVGKLQNPTATFSEREAHRFTEIAEHIRNDAQILIKRAENRFTS